MATLAPKPERAGLLESVDGSPLLLEAEAQIEGSKKQKHWWETSLIGPGLLVCLADTDAPCLIVACQSGAYWGYSLVLVQAVLVPILFLTQELTVRLGVYTKKGYIACIRDEFGPAWAWFACTLLIIACAGGIVSEMFGIASVVELWFSVEHASAGRLMGAFVAATLVVVVVLCCNYTQIEKIGIFFGMFELTFVLTMFVLHPSPIDVVSGMFTFHSESEYFEIAAANIGAVIMPWMMVFQQSAVVNRRLTTNDDYVEEAKTTLAGSFLTQLIMIGAIVSMAAARPKNPNLENMMDIVNALEPALGLTSAKVLLSLAFAGGSLCASFVLSLAAAWGLSDATGSEDSFPLERSPTEAPHFYASFVFVVFIGVLVLFTGVSVVQTSMVVLLSNALLMPIAVYFLYALATSSELPEHVRVGGAHKALLASVFLFCSFAILCTFAHALYYGGFSLGETPA